MGIYAYTQFDTQLIFGKKTNTHPTLVITFSMVPW